jgi:hypothetical protein
MKWTERWIARAQRKADQRAERFVRREEGVRAGNEPLSPLDRMESRAARFQGRYLALGVLQRAYANERHMNGNWQLKSRPYDASLGLAAAWNTWVTDGPVRGPDGVGVTISVRSAVLAGDAGSLDLAAGQDLPFRDPPTAQASPTWQELAGSRTVYTVCVRRTATGPIRPFCSFATETRARWYAVELARHVRVAGFTGLRPAEVFVERPRPSRSDRVLAEEIIGVRHASGHRSLWLRQRARARWRQLRTGRR